MAKRAKLPRTAAKAKGSRKTRAPGVKKLQSSQTAAEARYKLFAEAWLANGGNATQAAIDAGYSEKTAYSQGGRLLRHVDVVARIKAGQRRLHQKFELQTERVLEEAARIALADPRELFTIDGAVKPIHLWPDHVAAAVSSVKYGQYGLEVKLWNKPGLISDGMKHLGLFERDNRQKADAVAQLMEHVAEHSKPIPVRP